MEMEKQIEEEVAGRPAEEVEELVLDGVKATQISGLTDEYVNLEKLSMVECGLTTLKGFPTLPNLRRLDLMSNQLGDGELVYLKGCTAITQLNLSGNLFKDFSSLEPLKGLKSLKKLELAECPLEDDEEYKEKVFNMLGQITYLDAVDKDGQDDLTDESEVDEDEEGADEDEDGEEGSEGDEGSDGEDGEEDEEDDDDVGEDSNERGVKRKHAEEDEDD